MTWTKPLPNEWNHVTTKSHSGASPVGLPGSLSAAIHNLLGIGLDPVTPEWGAMANSGQNYLRQAPHITFVPSFAILLVVISLNLLGAQLRDFLDPRQRA